MEAKAPRYAVEEDGIRDRDGNDIADVELEKVRVSQDGLVAGVSYDDQDEEDDGEEVAEGSDVSAIAAMVPCHGRVGVKVWRAKSSLRREGGGTSTKSC
jgi:hypothetical protein